MTRPVVVLIGPPGAGKSTVGAILAQTLGVALRDTDADIEARTGRTIPDIFLDDGEEAFRAVEREAVVAALGEHQGVLALGGGSILAPATQHDLAEHMVVFLDVSLPHAAPRVGLSAPRPVLLGNPRARWQALMDARRGIYQSLATIMIDTDGRSPQEVAQKVLDEIEALGEDTPAAWAGGDPVGEDRT